MKWEIFPTLDKRQKFLYIIRQERRRLPVFVFCIFRIDFYLNITPKLYGYDTYGVKCRSEVIDMAREEQLKQEKKYAPGVSRELALAEKNGISLLP